MKRILILAAVVTAFGMLASESKANGWGTPPIANQFTNQPAPQAAAGPVGDRYGYNPFLRQMMWWKKDRCGNGCGTGGCGGPGAGMAPGGGGTMVYPINPYTRSPRDWFQN